MWPNRLLPASVTEKVHLIVDVNSSEVVIKLSPVYCSSSAYLEQFGFAILGNHGANSVRTLRDNSFFTIARHPSKRLVATRHYDDSPMAQHHTCTKCVASM